MPGFDLSSFSDNLCAHMLERMATWDCDTIQSDENGNILREFCRIAADMLQNDQGIDIHSDADPIPMDEALASQGLSLFAEGLVYALQRCLDLQLFGEPKHTLMQNLALEIFNQAKQIVTATYGQENTPDFQFSHEQQTEMLTKSIEGHIVSYVTEYEQTNGPLPSRQALEDIPNPPFEEAEEVRIPELPTVLPSDAPEALAPVPPSHEEAVPPAANVIPAPSKLSQSVASTTPFHQKAGAVALLLTTLPPEQQERLLQSFNPEERTLIAYYGHLAHVEQELDLRQVEGHLRQLQDLLKDKSKREPTGAQRLHQLIMAQPPEEYHYCIDLLEHERPGFQEALQSVFEGKIGQQDLVQHKMTDRRRLGMKYPLTDRLFGLLADYLNTRLEMLNSGGSSLAH